MSSSKEKHGAKEKAKGKAAAKGKHRGMRVLVAVFVVLAVLVGGSAAALGVDDGTRTQLVPTKTILDGKADVSGMTAEQLEKTVKARAKNGITAKVQLVLAGKAYPLELSDLGKVDAQATVAKAYEPYNESALQRYGERVVSTFAGNDAQTYEVSTVFAPSAKKLKAAVEEIAKDVDADSVSASYRYSNGRLVATKAKDGVKVDVDATVKALKKALSDPSGEDITVKGVTKKVKPATSELGQAIYVDTSACVLYLYEDGKVVVSYPCTPGMTGYETPTGDWTLSYKDPSPVWQNPHSDWSQNMPETIEPGESNPLGLRALAVSCGGGIFIHGTTNTGQLGSPGSHGCVRLANADIVSLYDKVSTGIPIFIR